MTSVSSWNPDRYLQFGDQRTRAAADLVSRVPLAAPGTVVDLGCGPGNSTALLQTRWPDAQIKGVDSSASMIEAARQQQPEIQWQHGDIEHWSAPRPVDLLFSNAALHWLPDHRTLLQRLFAQVAAEGVLAFQIPSSSWPAVRSQIHAVSCEAPWSGRTATARTALTMHPPSFYYDVLATEADRIDLWETEYVHVMPSRESILEWVAGTGLRPFLSALANDAEREQFVERLRRRLMDVYDVQADGNVLFPFRRLFVIAVRDG